LPLLPWPCGCCFVSAALPDALPALPCPATNPTRQGKEWIADAKAEQLAALHRAVADANKQLEDMSGSLHSGAGAVNKETSPFCMHTGGLLEISALRAVVGEGAICPPGRQQSPPEAASCTCYNLDFAAPVDHIQALMWTPRRTLRRWSLTWRRCCRRWAAYARTCPAIMRCALWPGWGRTKAVHREG
jgi:hypothetical protein